MTGPNRPRNINPTRINCPAVGRVGVIPVLSPTVANADTDSNSTLSVLRSVISASTIVADTTAATDSNATVNACRCARGSIRRRNTVVAVSPRTSDQMTKNNNAKVVTLIPPAVPADPPPMNMNTSMPNQVLSLHRADIDAVEPGGAQDHGLEKPGQHPPSRVEGPQGPRVEPLRRRDERRGQHQQHPGHRQRDLGVHTPLPWAGAIPGAAPESPGTRSHR